MGHKENHATENGETVSQAAREEKLSELEILRQSVEEKKKLADDYYDQLLRLKAEFENFRRRTEREKQNHVMWGKEDILLKQVSILDVLEQALQSARTSTNVESIRKGLELITQEFVRMMGSEGITAVDPKGVKFDPQVHEALEYVDSAEPDGTIVAVLQKGYTINGRVMRPARVQVAKNVAPQEPSGTPEAIDTSEQEA